MRKRNKIFLDGYSIAFICFIQWGIATMGIKVGLKSKGEEDLRRGLVCIRTKEYELSIPPFTASIFFKANLVKKLQEFSRPCDNLAGTTQ